MTQPISVRTDLSVMAAYIEYGTAESVETVDLTETGSVAYDLDQAGNIVGIEILRFEQPEHVAIAQEFAATHGLSFPRDLSGKVPA
jgi:uncharacterized protein YuzE